MDTTTLNKITEKVKLLPDSLAEEVLSYIDFLLFKADNDWYENLSNTQKESIENGLEDVKNGNLFSHESVMEEMEAYIKSKLK